MKPRLTENEFFVAADKLGCSVAAIKAVCAVEAPRGGFLPDGRPVILFERHVFSKRTGGLFDASHPDLSNPSPGGYEGGVAEHFRLARAAALVREAALQSASWGKFQIMGFNYRAAGFAYVQLFVNAMYRSEAEQLQAFVAFIKSEGLADELQQLKWADFARRYNGPDYARNKYDVKLADAYQRALAAEALS